MCLDFANTGGDQKAPEPSEDKIHDYAELVAFGVQTGDLSAADARKLLTAANHSPAKAEKALRKARDLRGAIYGVFASTAVERKTSREDVERLNRFLGEALSHSTLVAKNGGYVRTWDDTASLERPLWPIVASAAELMTSPEFEMVRQCNSERCSWLFVDRSRNHARRWCDMKVCGNRAKAKRHYERVKA